MTAQYSETSTDSDSSSYACEETRLPPNMGNEKPTEVIELPSSDADSGATTPAVAALSSTQKLEDWFDKTHAKASQPVEQNIDFIFLDDIDDINDSNQTMQVMHDNTCHPASDALGMKPSATMAQHELELDDFNSHVFNDEDDISKVVDHQF